MANRSKSQGPPEGRFMKITSSSSSNHSSRSQRLLSSTLPGSDFDLSSTTPQLVSSSTFARSVPYRLIDRFIYSTIQKRLRIKSPQFCFVVVAPPVATEGEEQRQLGRLGSRREQRQQHMLEQPRDWRP